MALSAHVPSFLSFLPSLAFLLSFSRIDSATSFKMVSKASRMSVNHAAGIFADMSVDGPAIGTLVAIIDRAKNLPNRKTMGKQNPYCAARLGKEAKKTETDLRGGQTPKW